ncbi:hypothetical protein QQP08_005605 [Theobroma cacao]|nr:hypothetical protein QQP08_005605 [Theobroma cacao]
MGSISPYIGIFSFLREVGRLHRLVELKLSTNSLVDEIPSNISACSKVRVVDLSSNQLVGEIPVAFGRLSNLKRVSLYKNI